jgi:allophanate hydrolase subunit 1
MGRDSSVGIATRYGLDGPGSNPGGGKIFRTCPEQFWDPPSLLYTGHRVFFLGVK